MIKNNVLTKIASLVILSSAITSCARFDTRTQAEGNDDYLQATLIEKFDSGNFSTLENRSTFDIQALSTQQEKLGLSGKDVDVRPPSQLMAVLDGVLLDPDLTQSKVWFNAFKQETNIEQKVWNLALQYLASKDAKNVVADRTALSIDTGLVVNQRSYGSLSKNTVREEGAYQLQLAEGGDGRSISLSVDATSYQQSNDNEPVKEILEGRNKRSIEIRFINDMLNFAYLKQESEALISADNKPLPIKLGFDESHQTAWIIDAEFTEVWRKLPALLQLMSFSPVDNDKNLGYFLVKFESQDAQYWQKRNLNPINLEEGEYFVQLGELTGGDTSLTWLNADKKQLSDQEVTELYLSITDNIRSVILENDIQTKPL